MYGISFASPLHLQLCLNSLLMTSSSCSSPKRSERRTHLAKLRLALSLAGMSVVIVEPANENARVDSTAMSETHSFPEHLDSVPPLDDLLEAPSNDRAAADNDDDDAPPVLPPRPATASATCGRHRLAVPGAPSSTTATLSMEVLIEEDSGSPDERDFDDFELQRLHRGSSGRSSPVVEPASAAAKRGSLQKFRTLYTRSGPTPQQRFLSAEMEAASTVSDRLALSDDRLAQRRYSDTTPLCARQGRCGVGGLHAGPCCHHQGHPSPAIAHTHARERSKRVLEDIGADYLRINGGISKLGPEGGLYVLWLFIPFVRIARCLRSYSNRKKQRTENFKTFSPSPPLSPNSHISPPFSRSGFFLAYSRRSSRLT